MIEVPEGWEDLVGEELRKNLPRYLRDGFADRYLSGANLLDVGYKGYLVGVQPILPHAVGVDLDYPGYDGMHLPFPDESQDAVVSSHTLEHIGDYRTAIAEWFRVLRLGGFLIITVPHQFLYERKRSLPSLWNSDHKRFYTSASLLAEVEEALDALSYRIRLLEENDRDFDYSAPPDREATGCQEVVLVIERIARPFYADAVLSEASEAQEATPLPVDDRKVPVTVIQSSTTSPQRIVALSLSHRGDFILASPALRLLRQLFPSIQLTLVCGSWNVGSARELGVCDTIVPFDYFNEAFSGLRDPSSQDQVIADFTHLMSDQTYDVAIDLRVETDTRRLLSAISASERAGFGTVSDFPFLDIALPCTSPTIAERAVRMLIGVDRFGSNIGRKDDDAIVFAEKIAGPPGDILVSGPYATLDPGHYTVEMRVEPLGPEFDLEWDVAASGGDDFLAKGRLPVYCNAYPKFQWTLSESKDDIEIRCRARSDGLVQPFRFLGCRVQKSGHLAGPHRQELMSLLIHLVALRLQQPFTVQEVRV